MNWDWDTVELLDEKDEEIGCLKEQNKSLFAELDKQIKENRKLVKLLKDLINCSNDDILTRKIKEVLKEVGED